MKKAYLYDGRETCVVNQILVLKAVKVSMAEPWAAVVVEFSAEQWLRPVRSVSCRVPVHPFCVPVQVCADTVTHCVETRAVR